LLPSQMIIIASAAAARSAGARRHREIWAGLKE
jgi:hypothetical protein